MCTRALSLAALLLVVSSLGGKPLPGALKGNGPVIYTSLLAKANMKLTESLGSGFDGNNLANLPRGEQTFAGKNFKVEDGLIHLGSTEAVNKPIKVEGIELNRKFARLHILHGTCFGAGGHVGDPADGTLIGEYRVQYADKTVKTIPIEYGKDVRDWWNHDESKAVTRGTLAWKGKNAATGDIESLRLYITAWENPSPEKLVAEIHYHSANTVCAPFCVALTLEAIAPSRATAKEVLEKLQGTWAAATTEQGQIHQKELVIREETGSLTYSVIMGNGKKSSSFNFTLKLDPQKDPAQVDLIGAGGRVYQGIYSLTDDVLNIRWSQPNDPRPTGFSGKDGGSELTLKKRSLPAEKK